MWDKILYLDICAAPVYMIIWFATIYRKLTRGRSNILYLWLTGVAFVTVLSELAAGFSMQSFPLSKDRLMFVTACEYVYFITRNATNTLYIFYIFSITETWYRIKGLWKKILLALPYIAILILLLFNNKKWSVFTVSASNGYARGDAIIALYFFATAYMIFGVCYLIFQRHTLEPAIWGAIFSMYVFNLIAVIIQFIHPELLIECYSTSMTLLFIVFFVQRPERLVDMSTGLPGYRAFCEEIRKLAATGQEVSLVISNMSNAEEMRHYLGEQTYLQLIYAIESIVGSCLKKERVSYSIYFEQPGNFYYIFEDMDYNPVQIISEARNTINTFVEKDIESGAIPDFKVVSLNYPADISEPDELFRFGHIFARFADPDKIFSRCTTIISRQDYQVETHIDDILNRAMDSHGVKIVYQPVWSVKDNRFVSASVRINISDEIFGDIKESLLLRAAEERGVIIRLGNYVLDQAFSFAGDEAFKNSSLDRICVTLSVTQCMQMDLTDKIWSLRDKYKIRPETIEFSIRESVYKNISSVFNDNIIKLSMQGYRITLDRYGAGFSDMQHILSMPLASVKIDKYILATAASSEKGRSLLEGSIAMIKNIPLEVAAKGVNNKDMSDMLIAMGADLLEGDYYSKALSGDELLNIVD